MERLTRKTENGSYEIDADKIQINHTGGVSGEAVQRLALFEQVYEDLLKKQREMTEQLEQLRARGKTRSVQFRELMGNRMMNNHLITLLKTYGLD